MKTYTLNLILFFMISSCSVFAQDTQNIQVNTSQEAYYPAGDAALCKFVRENIKYSDEALKKEIDGNIVVSFDVMPDSTLSGINLISGIGYGIDQQAIEILKKLKFASAILMKVKVRSNVIITIPIRTTAAMLEQKR